MKCFLKVKFLGCADLVFANWGGVLINAKSVSFPSKIQWPTKLHTSLIRPQTNKTLVK